MACRGRGGSAFESLYFQIFYWIAFTFFTYAEASPGYVWATEIQKPQQEVVLTVSGNVTNHNGNSAVQLDIPMLEGIGLKSLVTHTIYSSSAHQWHGVLMRDLLEFVGAKGSLVEIKALDGYSTTIPISDFYDYDVLLATKRNGKRLSIRSRGPTRIIYPVDHNPSLQSPTYTSRFVWQIEQIVVK
nr:molybdopterin-dependent oxidoreductase [uncultured Cohaesibacter sp.]